MEVLLLQDIEGFGKKNDLVVVGDGFALNFLLPKRAALVATPLVRKRYADLIRRRALEREQEKARIAGTVGAAQGKTVTFKRKATKNGKLYAAISEEAIADALQEQHEIEADSASIVLTQPIKALGTFPVQLQSGKQAVKFSVKVEAE